MQQEADSTEPDITTTRQEITPTLGTRVEMTVVASSPDGGTLTYQWYTAAGGRIGDDQLISEATQKTYVISSVTVDDQGDYRVVVTNTKANASSTSKICDAYGVFPTAEVVNCAVYTAPTKVTYTEGETLDLTGLVVNLTKSDSSTEDIAFEDFAANGITTVKANGAALVMADTEIVINIKGKTVIQAITVTAPDAVINPAAIAGVIAPVNGATPVTTITATDQYTAAVTWSPADGTFAADRVYTATITLTPKAGYTLTGVDGDSFTVTGATTVTNPANSGVITAVFPATASGQQTDDSDFKIVDGLLWEYKGADGDVVIPEGVIRVMDDAFAQNTSITSIYFPQSVEYVGNSDGALRGCTKLISLTFSNTTYFVDTDLNEHASIKELNIYRGGTDSIARNRFMGGDSENSTLEKINFGEGITEIGTWEFDNFKALKQVDFPDSLRIIGQNAFSGCEMLQSVVFPDALETIGGYSFSGCLGLSEIIIPKGINKVFNSAFKDCANLTKLSIPNGLTLNSTFEGCTKMNTLHITLSPYTTELDDIYTDLALDAILIDEGITSIGYYTFSGQTKLKELHLPETLESISDGAFAGCSNLESITIPIQTTNTSPTAFVDCPNLKNITISYKDNPIVSNRMQLPGTVQTLTIAEGITTIEAWNLNNLHSLTTLLLPGTLIKIESNSFNGCEQLENFRFPKALERLDNDCFKDSVKLTELTIQSNGLSFGENTFENCDQLKTLKVLFSGSEDFRLNSSLLPIEEIYIGEGFTRLDGLFSAPSLGSSSLKKVTLPESLIEIGGSAFGNCNNLNEINIPSNVTQVGSFAFENCTSLKSVILPDSVTHIQDGAFYGCAGLEHLAISRNVQQINNDAFSGCTNITQLEIPSKGPQLQGYSYANIQKLTLLDSPSSMNVVSNTIDAEEIIIEDGFTEIDSSSFRNLARLKKISFPSSIRRIGSDSFENCSNLEELVFPNGLISIGSAFKNCSKLSAVSIPGSVESIGAFDGCESLDTITISNTSLQRLNNKPFYTCRPKTINVLYSAEASAMSGYYLPFADTVNIAEGITSIGSLGYLNGKEIVVPKSVTNIARINADIWRSDYPCPKTMKVYYNSYAHQFALENNVPFSFIDRELEDDAVSGVTIIEESKVILLNSEELLVHEVLPATAGNKNVTWVSSNPEIATVDNFGHVKGLKEGTATITVTTEEGGFQDSCEITVFLRKFPVLPTDSIVHRVLNAEGNSTLMTKVSDTNLNLYLANDYFRHTVDKWWNIWMGSNITVNGSTALQLMAFQYTNVKTKAFYEGFYGDLFMNYSEPGTLTKNCAQIIYHLIHNYPDAIIPVNLTLSLPSGVNSDALSLTDLTWYLDRADSEMVFNLLNDYDSVLTVTETFGN
ncbi:MAG TPA: leucine-rich repeat protein [Desulfosporosinus sp.]|nr:leucine-rich repeat protein [Desulfosporosinus sp.]